MNTEFAAAYRQLNTVQKQAVDMIEGPLLVLAGPGTGKTQLLSTRAANIVAKGGVAPTNILCITYTEAGASEMRQRLGAVMGPNGGEIAVHTFHSFGRWLIAQYPERFSTERALQPLDDLGRYQIIETLLSKLPFRHQLAVRDENERFIRQHAVEEAIRAFKQGGLAPADVRRILQSNEAAYKKLLPLLQAIFDTKLSAKRLDEITGLITKAQQVTQDDDYSAILLHSLSAAAQASVEAGKTAALGAWRTSYTTIKNGERTLKSAAQQQLLLDTVTLYERYDAALQRAGRFDYEDMILWAAAALEEDEDIRLDVAERFQYIMVDEYQDTNGAQNRLLDNLLRAHPVDSPNIMAVGDDDQAIMRFQGAEMSGMLRFIDTYQPRIVSLQDNYRSGQPILDASRQIITQTTERLEANLADVDISKALTAHTKPTKLTLAHHQYVSQSAQYEAIAEHVVGLLKQGVEASQIGIIGRKHSELANFVPFLTAHDVQTHYDRRENILEHPAITLLLQLARYLQLQATNPTHAAQQLPQLLSASYWGLPPLTLYRLAAEAKAAKTSWLETMLQSQDPTLAAIAEWLLAAAAAVPHRNFTQALDILIGREALTDTTLQQSPFAKLYTDQPAEVYTTILSHCIRLRAAVLESQPAASTLTDMLTTIDAYRRSGIYLIDDNPLLRGSSDAVHVMSAHGSKGREFEHVIILSTVDEVWGNRARSNNQRIRLPENLPLYPAGDADSDKLRLLYVAMTRAKNHLTLTSYEASDAGRAATPLSFLLLGGEDGWWQPQPTAISPATVRTTIESTWSTPRYTSANLRSVLQPALANYRLSASALRSFLDIRYGGPEACIEQHVLKFPSAYNAHSALGSATHRTLQVAHSAYSAQKPLSTAALLKVFDETLAGSGLSEVELASVRAHAHQFLPGFIDSFSQSDFSDITATEQFLTSESPQQGIPLSGAVDAIASNDTQLRVIDYKTGTPPPPNWRETGLSDSKRVSLHFYKQQLLFYKLLIEQTRTYAKQHVSSAELVFVEADPANTDECQRLKLTEFDEAELARTEALMKAVYTCITQADLPDITAYSRDLKGITAFEEALLAKI